VEIMVFEADTRASKGLTAAHVQEAATLYDAEKAPAPLVFGHPTNDSPALGVVESFRCDGPKVFARLKGVAKELVDAVRSRRVLNRSVALWDPHHPSNPNPGKFSFRHLGFLGGQAPAIPNMPALKFSADDTLLESDEPPADAVIFAVDDRPTGVQRITEPAPEKEFSAVPMSSEEIAAKEKELQDRQDAMDRRDREFAAAETTRRQGENKAAIDKAVADGKVLPAEAEDLAAIFNALPVQALTFAVGGAQEPRQRLASFLEALPPRTPGDESGKPPLSPGADGKEFSATPEAKAAADGALAAANKGLSEAWRNPAGTSGLAQ
jgi:hypothetical protein